MSRPQPFAEAALELAGAGWPVFPCTGKVPLTEHGHVDASTDADVIAAWAKRWPSANIGGRVPESLVVLDVDPRNGGRSSLGLLEAAHGALPATLCSFTGGGGVHLFYLRPPGLLRNGAHQVGPGCDVKLGGKGYVILPPSIHPETSRAYRWEEPIAPIAPMPGWLTSLLRPATERPATPRPELSGSSARRSRPTLLEGDRPGDLLAEQMSWAQILEPAGWRFVGQRGDISYWRRPGKTEGVSATVNALGTDRLHVFTSSAPSFEPDTSYSKFGAWTHLYCGGDFSEAARQLRKAVSA